MRQSGILDIARFNMSCNTNFRGKPIYEIIDEISITVTPPEDHCIDNFIEVASKQARSDLGFYRKAQLVIAVAVIADLKYQFPGQ
eukprot:gene9815-9880_t